MSPYENMCIRSFLDHGHSYDLYSFEPALRVPDGCNLCDARQFFDEDEVIYYGEGIGRGSVSLFSNQFRYKLLYVKGGWWVDTDVVCMRSRLPRQSYVFGFQDPAHELICTAILKCPAGSSLASDCLTKAQEIGDSASWGQTGPILLTTLIRQLGLEAYAKPFGEVYPYPHHDALKILDPKCTSQLLPACDDSPFVHLWNEMLRRSNVDKFADPPRGSLLSILFQTYLTEMVELRDRET